ncbi:MULTISPECIES: DUF6118 family protein [Rhizobium/Agrobacterium group]|jgi:hypothetical protein|uniref:DUF6118 family protein n=1 Tax=Rhizobium/Agrobacterium group TaxID=227290 RepID=UPI0008DC195B|nr:MULTISPECIES: DUF6118 family protein [Rhizobium/Agrobacterium group]NTF59323.1 hypothetical protein [Rhizobium rhizogenes]MCF1436926.1 hypothetical protein [Allorhizobium ampelinum]MCF1496107.1 hypothetical protein [Allorhizobium ampelinum]MUO92495.1 hypothetical protein [Agrobacterium vitis]NTA51640.1 hypothetical protein [Agrobacterium tumefaciens]
MTELDDDREGFEPEDAGDPAAAFDALRQTVDNLAGDLTREMTTIRKGVEAAFEEFDRHGPPEDYKPELAQIVQQLAHVAERLHGVEQTPILRQGAQHYAAALERSGEGLVRTAVQQLERQAADLARISSVLASHNKSAFHRKDQDFRMWMAGGIGIIAGAFLLALLPRFLPFSADSHVAALVMGNDRINAAYAMINSVDPIGVKKMQWGAGFYEASGGEISACLEKARQTAKDQKCNITVPAPKEGL